MTNYDLTSLPLFLTPKEFAEVLRISEYSTREMINDGSLPGNYINGGNRQRCRILIHRDAINHILTPANPLAAELDQLAS